MKLCRCLLAFSLLVIAAGLARAQVPPEKVLSTFSVSEGLELSLWASEPLSINPTCIDIDHRGRVWLCESINYRDRLRHRPLHRKEGDRIVILEDTRGTGKADRATVFYQAPDILAPLGIAVAKDPEGPGYKVYVCQSPDILLFEDKDGDSKADGPPRKLLTGFRGYDHDHGVHGILLGPDSKLYFSVGDQGVSNLQSADGKGRKFSSNNTDCQAGTVWRCDLDGTNLELVAHNFRNEYEPAVDSFGTVFVSDNDDDGNRMTRICYVMPGGNYGYHPRGPGQTHWHEEQPGVVPMVLRTYFGSPTGLCFYEGNLLPEKYRGQPLHTDAGPRHLRCYHLTPQGASYAVEPENIISSTDTWFRASDVCVAPDGSVFVADWYDPGVGGHGMGDTTRGRIYRLVPKGHKGYQVPKVDLTTKEGLLAALASPNLAVRYMANSKLQSMPSGQAQEVLQAGLAQQANPFLRARSLWQLARVKGTREQVRRICTEAISDPTDPRFSILALRVLKGLGISPADLPPSLQQELASSPRVSAAVRRECLLLLRDVDPAKAGGLILQLAKRHDGKDRFYLEAVGIAVGHYDQTRREAILKDFSKEFPKWDDKVLDLIWELRPTSALPQLGKRLSDADIPAGQRARIIDILAASNDASAGKTLLAVLKKEVPSDVHEHILTNLRTFLPGKWSSLRNSPEMRQAIKGLLAKADTRAIGLDLIGAAEHTGSLDAVVQIARNKGETAAVQKAAIQTLGELPSERAARALTALVENAPVPLRVEAVQSLGQLLDPRGNNPGSRAARTALQAIVEGKEQALNLKQAAVEGLAGNRQGTIWLLALHARGGLPKELHADTARLLRNTPFRDLRTQANVAFPPPGKLNPKKLPPISVLVQRKGDAERGRKLLDASIKGEIQCLKCHTVQGVGGHIGPDLSVIGKKGSLENLFESILLPNKAIADQFVSWQIETTKGLALIGLLVEETPEAITLRDGNGKDQRILKKDIETKVKSPQSLMPSDLLVYMTEDDLVDIVAYLATLKTPALNVPSWHIVGPFDNGEGDRGMDVVYPPEKGIDLKATYPGKSGKVSWQKVTPDATGFVDLQAFHAGRSDNIISYLYQEVESPKAQEGTILLGADDCAKVWVNGKLVHTNRTHQAASPGQYRIKVPLVKGTNQVLIKINNGDGPHGLFFTLLAEEEVKLAE